MNRTWTTRLLIIDDDPSLLTVLETGLRLTTGAEVTAVVRAAEAIRLLEQQRWDLVITDYSLDDPAINGLEIMRCARRHAEPPLVILITAFSSMELTLNAIRNGAYDFLTKPFQLEELQMVVRNASEKIRLERERNVLAEELDKLQAHCDAVEQQQNELTTRIEQLMDEWGRAGGHDSHAAAPGPSLEAVRRRYEGQLSAYLKSSRGLSDTLSRARGGGNASAAPPQSIDASLEA